jgi:ribosomal protein S27E
MEENEKDWEGKLRRLWEESDSVKKPLKELFEVKCKNCGSSNIAIPYDYDISEGCPTCGISGTFLLALKCRDCGNAKVVRFEVG